MPQYLLKFCLMLASVVLLFWTLGVTAQQPSAGGANNTLRNVRIRPL